MQHIYDRLFGMLKAIEATNDPKERVQFSFSAHGRNQNIKFQLAQSPTSQTGTLTYEPLPPGMGRGQMPPGDHVILDSDLAKVREQCEKVEVSEVVTEITVKLFKGMQELGLELPTFNVGRTQVYNRTQMAYVLGVAGYVPGEDGEHIGRIELNAHVYTMSNYEKQSRALLAARDEREAQGRKEALKRIDAARAARASTGVGHIPNADGGDVKQVVVLG